MVRGSYIECRFRVIVYTTITCNFYIMVPEWHYFPAIIFRNTFARVMIDFKSMYLVWCPLWFMHACNVCWELCEFAPCFHVFVFYATVLCSDQIMFRWRWVTVWVWKPRWNEMNTKMKMGNMKWMWIIWFRIVWT